MFAHKFVDQVDTHADQLCELFMRRIKGSDRCRALLQRVPAVELQQSIRAIYRNLIDCLLNRTDSVSEELYLRLGARRAQQGVPSSDSFWAVCASRQYFWEYMESETLLEDPADVWGGVELLRSLDQFFDRVVYLIIMGYQTGGKNGHCGHAAVSTEI